MTSHDELLDQYIDDLNAGRRATVSTDDADLAELFHLADQFQPLRQPDWPPASFATDMASRLTRELTVKSNGHAVLATGDHLNDTAISNPWIGEASEPARLEAFPPRKSRLRQSIQIAGALAAFAVFAMVLTMIFREDDAGSPVAAPPIDMQIHEIAFAAVSDGNVDIFVVNSDGSDLRNLTDSPAIDSQPQWSPNGDRIAFISDRSGLSHIYTMNPDGTDVFQVTTGPYHYADLKWSPDGRMVAALRYDEDDTNFYSARLAVFMADGSDEWEIIRHEWPTASSMFTWSPESDEIAVSVGLSGRGPQILIYSLDGSDVRTLYESEGFQFFPAWSPDGAKIVFVESGTPVPDRGGNRLVEVDLDTEMARILYDSDSNIFDPAWSPDSSKVALSRFDPADRRGIVIITTGENIEVSSPEETNESDRPVTWSPDSTQMAFVRGNVPSGNERTQALMVMNADGTGLTQIAIDVMADAPSWRPARSESQDAPDPTPTTDRIGPESEHIRLIADSGQVEGNAAYIINYDGETERFLTGGWSDIEVGESTLHARPGSEVRLVLPSNETVPDEISAIFYRWDDNTSESGETFSILTPPVHKVEIDPDVLTFSLPESSDRYVVLASLTWTNPPVEGLPVSQLVMGVVFNVTVADDAPTEHDPNIYDAIEIVRNFLHEPSARLEVVNVEGNIYELHRYIEGPDVFDQFLVDMDYSRVTMATLMSRSSRFMPSNPFDEEVAMAMAQHYLWQWVPQFEEMSVLESSSDSLSGLFDQQDLLFTVTFAILDEDTGAWIPPRAMFQINMETGQVVFFGQSLATYEHSTVPTFSAEQAEAIALDHVSAQQNTEEQLTVRQVQLVGFEDAMPIDSNLVWQVTIDEGLYFVDAHTGEIVTFSSPDIDQSEPETGDHASSEEDAFATEPEPDEIISKGVVVDILQDAFGIPVENLELTLFETEPDDWIYFVRQPLANGSHNIFTVDARDGHVRNANLVSNQTITGQVERIEEQEARQIAMDIAASLTTDFHDLVEYVSPMNPQPTEGVYSVFLGLQDATSGAWLPRWVGVSVNMETGDLYEFSQDRYQYNGPLTPLVSEDDAIAAAREIANQDAPIEGSRRLILAELRGIIAPTTPQQGGELQENAHRLAWFVLFENTSSVLIDAITGEPVQ